MITTEPDGIPLLPTPSAADAGGEGELSQVIGALFGPLDVEP